MLFFFFFFLSFLFLLYFLSTIFLFSGVPCLHNDLSQVERALRGGDLVWLGGWLTFGIRVFWFLVAVVVA